MARLIVALGCMAILTLAASWAPAEEKAPAEKPAAAPAPADKEGFRPLFTGKDIAGWKEEKNKEGHWAAEGGVLKYDGKGSHLWTEESFADFILKIDWRLPAPGDSGIYLRGNSKSQVNIWTNELGSGEVYGYRTDAKQPEEVRKGVTPRKKADKPVGEWNSFLITMKGDRLTVVLNGEEVISSAQLPGVPKTGTLALQHHGQPMEFRNIAIKVLEAAPAAAPRKQGEK